LSSPWFSTATGVTVTSLNAAGGRLLAPGCDIDRAIDAVLAYPIAQSSPLGARSGPGRDLIAGCQVSVDGLLWLLRSG
jgi:hypothetical protein